MTINIIPPLLALLIYFPIFIFALLSKKFKNKFMQIHAQTESEKLEEVFVGIIYFLFLVFLLFTNFTENTIFFFTGLVIYIISIFITYFGYVTFYYSKEDELIKKFPYSFSRNPTYFFGLLALLGLIISIKSVELTLLLLIQFFLTHQIIINEERYCQNKFKKQYEKYFKKVRRYF